MARRPRPIRTVEDLPRTVEDLDHGRHLGKDPSRSRRQRRRHRRPRVGAVSGLDLRSGAPACGWCPEKGGCADPVEALAVAGECLGRSRGGLTSKIHLAVDGTGIPLSIILTEGQVGDNPQLLPLLEQISVRRPGPGRPRTIPEAVLADKAYSHPSTRAAMRAKRIRFTCPERSDQIDRRQAKGPAGGRPPAFDREEYKRRNLVERCFNRFKQFRDLATRYAKRAAYYTSEIIIASLVLRLR